MQDVFKKKTIETVIVYALLMTVPAILMLKFESYQMGELCRQPPDARLYLSIADNFLSTGHFIQTDRPVAGLVVPPGLPMILVLFRLLHFSVWIIMAVQTVMFGICNILLYETARKICSRGIWAPVIYTMAYLRCWIKLGVVLVEHYYLFLICLAVWVVYKDYGERKKIILLNLIGLAMLLTRPLLSPVYLTILGYTLWWCGKNRRQTMLFALLLLPISVFVLNILVNYRETGEFIFLENYSGSDMYTASRLDAPVYVEDAADFMDETYIKIDTDETLTMQQKNKIFRQLALENIKNHPDHFLLNGLLRGHELFMKLYAWATLYTLAGGILLARKEKRDGNVRAAVMLALTIFLAVISSFGVPEARYSMIIWPMASVHGAYITNLILDRLFR